MNISIIGVRSFSFLNFSKRLKKGWAKFILQTKHRFSCDPSGSWICFTEYKASDSSSSIKSIWNWYDLPSNSKKLSSVPKDLADQASLNGFAYENSKKESISAEWEETEMKESSTYSSILNLRANIPNHSYVQYTATPQGPLLISILDLLSPKSHTVLTPGKKYTGGKTFFQDYPDLVISIPTDELGKKSPMIYD